MKRLVFIFLLTVISYLPLLSQSQFSLSDSTVQDDSLVLFSDFDVSPKFPGGELEFYKYLTNHIDLDTLYYLERPLFRNTKLISSDLDATSTEVENPIRVYVNFKVSESGKIEDVKVVHGGNEQINNYLISVFRSMPDWQPALKEGKPVAAYLTFPVKFEMR